VARLSGLPPATVCSDAALARIAASRPASIDALAAIDGIGPLAARRFGPRLLAIIADAPA
jgi:superfamily II DNA helicase RecQ